MSSTSSASASASSTGGNGSWVTGNGTGNSSLYLFTFLITIVILATISGGLLFRAYYVRRQFRRQVEEAIRAGRPLPENAAQALGPGGPANNNRRKKEKKHGPQPGMWEAELWREDEEKWAGSHTEKPIWDDITPLSVTHAAPPPPPPEPVNPAELLPQRRGPWFLRPFLTPRMSDLSTYIEQHPSPSTRPGYGRTTTSATLPPVVPAWTIPEDGEDVVVGVLIAFPVEGKDAERWDVEDIDPDEMEVPNVCLGVMDCSVRGR